MPDCDIRCVKPRLDYHPIAMMNAYWDQPSVALSGTCPTTALANCAQAKIDAASKVRNVQRTYRDLMTAQQPWVQSLSTRIAGLHLTISTVRV